MVVAVASSEMALLRPLIQLWARRRALGGTKESRFLTEVWIAAIGTCVGLSWAVLAGGGVGVGDEGAGSSGGWVLEKRVLAPRVGLGPFGGVLGIMVWGNQ